MCECGCGEMTSPVVWFAGSPGFHYGLALYGGCMGCGNPAWFTIYRVPDAELSIFVFGDDAPKPVQWVKMHGWEEFSVPLGPSQPKESHHRLARAGFDAFLKEQAARLETPQERP